MKKIIGFLLLFTLIFTICGCQNNDIDVRGKYENDTTQVSSDISNDTNSTAEEFSLGKITENVYKNDFIGIGYTLDENWIFYNDEQLKELNNITVDMMGDELRELVKNATIIYDMYAIDSVLSNNISINLEKVSNAKLLSLNIEENYKMLFPTLKYSYENAGFENIEFEIIDIEVDGKILDAIYVTAEINGVDVYQTIFQKKCNGYLASIGITTYFFDIGSDLIDNFFWIE